MASTKHQNGLQGTIKLCGDKSLSHRAVMFASLCDGKSVLRGLSSGTDVASTCNLFRNLGVTISGDSDEIVVRSAGRDGFDKPRIPLDCGNSGTTMRLCAGILAGSRIGTRLVGDSSLSRRPMRRIVEPLSQMGANIECENDRGCAPISIKPSNLRGINFKSTVASAQVKSALLLAGMSAEGKTSVTEPEKSRDHTERLLQALGCKISIVDLTVSIEPGQGPLPFEFDIPADTSTSVIMAVAALLMKYSEVRIEKVLLNPTRTGGFEILRKMGGRISYENMQSQLGEESGDVVVSSSSLTSTDTRGIATASFIDEIPILAVAAAGAEGESVFRRVDELRIKESDRVQGVIDLLRCYGISASANENDLRVIGGEIRKLSEPQHHGDHRLAMAAEVLNLIAEGEMIGSFEDVISISAPEFYPQLCAVLQ